MKICICKIPTMTKPLTNTITLFIVISLAVIVVIPLNGKLFIEAFLSKPIFNLDVIAPLLLLVFVRKYNKITLLVFVQWVLNMIAFIMAKYHVHSNILVYQINICVSVLLVELFFKRKYLFLIPLCIIIFEGTNTFNTLSWCGGSLIIIFYCIQYFISKIKNYSTKRLIDDSEFWYASGLLFYYLGTFTIFLVYSFRTVMNLDITRLWELNNVLYLLMCVYFFIGIKSEK